MYHQENCIKTSYAVREAAFWDNRPVQCLVIRGRAFCHLVVTMNSEPFAQPTSFAEQGQPSGPFTWACVLVNTSTVKSEGQAFLSILRSDEAHIDRLLSLVVGCSGTQFK